MSNEQTASLAPLPEAPRIAVLMACHNRRDQTRVCLERLIVASNSVAEIMLFVVDDGSTDGTSEMIRGLDIASMITETDGTLYWAASMSLAELSAVVSSPDYLLWLNDDTNLDPDGLRRLLEVASGPSKAIAVGATREPGSDVITYGGLVRLGRHPQRLRLLPNDHDAQEADTFNGNCVLIPSAIHAAVGFLDGAYKMECADIDYGYRAREAGFRILVPAGTVGECAVGNRPLLSGGPLRRWQQMNGPKGLLPWRAQVRFLRRYGGLFWWAYFLWGYAKRVTFSMK